MRTVCGSAVCAASELAVHYVHVCAVFVSPASTNRSKSDMRFQWSPPIMYIPVFDFEYTMVRWSWNFSISLSFEFGGLYIDAMLSNFEPGSLICAHTILQSVSQFSKAFSLYSISSLKRMNTPPPDFLSFRNT